MSRELDAEVAVKVFGLSKNCSGEVTGVGASSRSCAWCAAAPVGSVKREHTRIPHEFSTRIDWAFQVVEKMRELGWSFNVSQFTSKEWIVDFHRHGDLLNERDVIASASTASEAICLAALASTEKKP